MLRDGTGAQTGEVYAVLARNRFLRNYGKYRRLKYRKRECCRERLAG
jgi:hypothetical protein